MKSLQDGGHINVYPVEPLSVFVKFNSPWFGALASQASIIPAIIWRE